MKQAYKDKELIVFDLDGTLAESKSVMDREMSGLLAKLLSQKKVAVIGGGKYSLFKTQVIGRLRAPKALLKNLFLFPTTSTSFYRYENGWKNVYTHELPRTERKQIIKTFARVLKELQYKYPKKVYGPLIEDRGTQVTFSALGQKAPVAVKKRWVKKYAPLKMKIAERVQKHLPRLEVRAAGYTSIDVTKKGIDKAYGIRQIERQLRISRRHMLFVGDAIFPGGNDYAVIKTGVEWKAVRTPGDTKKIIRALLK